MANRVNAEDVILLLVETGRPDLRRRASSTMVKSSSETASLNSDSSTKTNGTSPRPRASHDARFILLVWATGAGAAGRQALGTAVFGGMITATVLAVFFVPAFYVAIQKLIELRNGPPKSRLPSFRRLSWFVVQALACR